MQIFSTSHTHSFSSSRELGNHRGFTLVELLVSVAIIGMVTSIVLVKYSSFDSTVLLKDTAYEIALALREAQVKSVSAVKSNGCSDCPYGVSFNVTNATEQKRYRAFQYASSSQSVTPKFVDGTYPTYPKTIATTTIGRSMQVGDICVKVASSGTEDCAITRLDISFRRPDFSTLVYAVGGGYGAGGTPSNVEYTKILVNSTSNANGFYITITQFGQITVTKQP